MSGTSSVATRARAFRLALLAAQLASQGAAAQEISESSARDEAASVKPPDPKSPTASEAEAQAAVQSDALDEAANDARDDLCLNDHRRGQQLERSGRLLEAARFYRNCLHPACSPLLREDCGGRLSTVEAQTPTVILAPQNDGKDLVDVAVYDGEQLLVDRIGGLAITLDPGPHLLKFVAPGFRPASHAIVTRAGEKNRVIVVDLGGDHAERSTPAAVATDGSQPPQPAPRTLRRSPWGPWEYGLFAAGAGLGAGALGVGIWAIEDYRTARNECSPNCGEERINRIRFKTYAADALLALSIAAVVLGTVRLVVASTASIGRTELILSPGFVSARARF